MSETVRRAEEGGEVADAEAMRKVADGQKAQQAAVGRFRDGFNDWATTLRTVFPNGRHQLQLGLTTPARAATDGAAEDTTDGAEAEGSAAPASPAPAKPIAAPSPPA